MPGRRDAPVTMQDVARLAGVSPQTVSNVVNGRSARVGAATRERVAASINALGYRVNQSARSLRRGRSGTVGLGLPTYASEYYAVLAEELSRRFADRGLRLVVEHTGGVVRAEVDSLASSHLDAYDGFVLALGDAEHFDRIETSTPVVLLGERALTSRFDHVPMDNIGGARLATEHLLASGARSIVALGGSPGDEEAMPSLRTRGYLDAHAAAGVVPDPALIVPCPVDHRGGYEGITALLARGHRFDAVFALTDACAIGALRALADAALGVPDDVQVIGFDNISAGEYTAPRLTTVEPGNAARAATVVELLTARMEGDEATSERRVVTHPVSLIERESTRRRS